MIEKFASPKRIAFALIGIASQTMVSVTVLSVLMLIDLGMHLYLVLMQILKQIPTVDSKFLAQINFIENYVLRAGPEI